jgi:hypothetical protein
MSGLNLNVQHQSLKLLSQTDHLQRMNRGSYVWGIDVEDLGLVRLLASGEKKKIALDEATKRKLISFIRYFPLSDNPNEPDYVDFLAENFLELLHSLTEPHRSHILTSELDKKRKIPVNTEFQIRTRLSRLLQKEEFARGYLDHLSKTEMTSVETAIFDLKQIPQTIKDLYIQENRKDQLKYSNRSPLMGTLRPLLSWLPEFMTRWIFGATKNQVASSLVSITSAAAPEALAPVINPYEASYARMMSDELAVPPPSDGPSTTSGTAAVAAPFEEPPTTPRGKVGDQALPLSPSSPSSTNRAERAFTPPPQAERGDLSPPRTPERAFTPPPGSPLNNFTPPPPQNTEPFTPPPGVDTYRTTYEVSVGAT